MLCLCVARLANDMSGNPGEPMSPIPVSPLTSAWSNYEVLPTILLTVVINLILACPCLATLTNISRQYGSLRTPMALVEMPYLTSLLFPP